MADGILHPARRRWRGKPLQKVSMPEVLGQGFQENPDGFSDAAQATISVTALPKAALNEANWVPSPRRRMIYSAAPQSGISSISPASDAQTIALFSKPTERHAD